MKINKNIKLREDDLEQEAQDLSAQDKQVLTDILSDDAEADSKDTSETKVKTSDSAQQAAAAGNLSPEEQKETGLKYDWTKLDSWLEKAGVPVLGDNDEKLYDVLDAIYNSNNINAGMDTDPSAYGDEIGPYADDVDDSEFEDDDFDYGSVDPDFDEEEDDYEYDLQGNRQLVHDNSQPLNLLCIGNGGAGKTSIIEKWVHKKRLNYMELVGSELDAAYIKGIPFHITDKDDKGNVTRDYVKNLNNTKFDPLDMPGQSVLFIDEINRSYTEARAALLKIIQSHKIPDSNSKSGDRPLNNLLFVIAAMNPPSDNYEGAQYLDIAMLTRFAIYNWEADPAVTLSWYNSVCRRRLKRLEIARKKGYLTKDGYAIGVKMIKGRRRLANTILSDDSFRFSTNKEEDYAKEHQLGVLNARTLTSALDASDGTVNGSIDPKNSFRTWFKRFCGYHQVPTGNRNNDGTPEMVDDEITQIMDIILADVEDAEDENNAALKTPAQLMARYLNKQGIRV